MKPMRRHVILSAAKYLLFFVAAALVIPGAPVIPSAARNLHAQTARPVPRNAKEVLARHAAATGSDLRDKKPIHIVAIAKAPGMESRVETYAIPPNKVLLKMTLPGIGATTSGFDGRTGWTISDATGPMLLPMEQAKALVQSGAAPGDQQEGATYTLGGEMKLDGRRVWIVDGLAFDSSKFTQYFDHESGLLVGMDAGDYRVAGKPLMSFRDYRRFGGVLISTLMVTRMPTGDSLVARVVEFDQKAIPDSMFALPASIKALLPKQPAWERK